MFDFVLLCYSVLAKLDTSLSAYPTHVRKGKKKPSRRSSTRPLPNAGCFAVNKPPLTRLSVPRLLPFLPRILPSSPPTNPRLNPLFPAPFRPPGARPTRACEEFLGFPAPIPRALAPPAGGHDAEPSHGANFPTPLAFPCPCTRRLVVLCSWDVLAAKKNGFVGCGCCEESWRSGFSLFRGSCCSGCGFTTGSALISSCVPVN